MLPSLDAPRRNLVLSLQEHRVVHARLQLNIHERAHVNVTVVLIRHNLSAIIVQRLHRYQSFLSFRQLQRLFLRKHLRRMLFRLG